MSAKEIQGTRFTWQLALSNRVIALKIASDCNLTYPVAAALNSRGFEFAHKVSSFLFSSFERDVAHASELKDINTAVERIEKALLAKEKILIFGDYDVDGATATSIVLLALMPLGANINYFLPNRSRDGYGISSKIVHRAADAGFSLIITVDNGICAHEAAKTAQERSIDMIITDHHQPAETLPAVCAIVNPHQKECKFPNKELCGAGVAFKLVSLLYEKQKLALPEKIYELITLGTIADVVPLVNENRYWVRQGLARLNANMSPHIAALLANNNSSKSQIGSQDIAFGIAPQINALGRMDDPRDAVRFLISTDEAQIKTIAVKLGSLNEKRKEAETVVLQDVENEIQNKKIDINSEHIIFSAHENWPTGLIGLVAGRLTNRYGRPVFLFHLTKDGLAKGSCRSIDEFNVYEALCQNKDILKSFGGHRCAAGLSLPQENLEKLKEALETTVAKQFTIDQLRPKLQLDASLELRDTNKKLTQDLEKLEPFGNQNPVPTFLVNDLSLVRPPQLLKKKHVKCMFFSNGIVKPAIFFNRPDLFDFFLSHEEKTFTIAAHVLKNEWNGQTTVELQGLDAALGNNE